MDSRQGRKGSDVRLQRLETARCGAESRGSLPLLDSLEIGLPPDSDRHLRRWTLASVQRIAGSSSSILVASRVFFIIVVLSVIAGEVVFFYQCLAPMDACTCKVDSIMICPQGLLLLLVPIVIGAALLSMLCKCFPMTAETLWWIPEWCAFAAVGCRSFARRVSRIRKAWMYWFKGAKDHTDLLLWAKSLSEDQQTNILMESEQAFQAQDWEGALVGGRALAVVRGIHQKHLAEAASSTHSMTRVQTGGVDGWRCECGIHVVPHAAQGPGLCAWQEELDARCDGCNAAPISGMRFKCTKCANFDFCSACYDDLQNGLLVHPHASFIEISSNGGSCCNCAKDVRAWADWHYEERACVMCRGRRISLHLSRISLAHKHLGQFDKAVEVSEELLRISREWGNKAGEVTAHDNLARCFQSMGPDMVDKVVAHAEQQLMGARELGLTRAEAAALQHLGAAHECRGEHCLAIELHEKCLEIARNLQGEDCILQMPSKIRKFDYYFVGDPYSTVTLMEGRHKKYEALVLYNLASCYCRMEKYARALDLGSKAHAVISGRATELRDLVNREIDEYRHQQMTGSTLRDQFSWGGLLGIKWGDVSAGERARELQTQLDRSFLGDKYLEGEICACLGRCYTACGQYGRALELHKKHWDLAMEARDKASQAAACNDLGTVLQLQGKLSEAVSMLCRGLSLHQNVEVEIGSQDERRVSIFELQQAAYVQLQGVLLLQGHVEWALGVCSLAKARALAHGLTASSSTSMDREESLVGACREQFEELLESWWDEERRMASEEGPAVRIIEFTFLSDNKLAIWVMDGEGELVCSVVVPSAGLGHAGGLTMQKLLQEARDSMKVRGRHAQASSEVEWRESTRPSQLEAETTSSNRGKASCSKCKLRMDKCKCEEISINWERTRLRELYQVLLESVEKDLANAEELLIIPHRDLFEVPWASLIDSDGEYLIKQHIIRVAPSLRVARRCAETAQQQACSRQDTHALVIGNPWPHAASGLEWNQIGTVRPMQGRELNDSRLVTALRERTKLVPAFSRKGLGKRLGFDAVFLQHEWDKFDIIDLRTSDYVMVDDVCFQPAVDELKFAEEEAKTVAQMLRKATEDVRLRVKQEATCTAVMKELQGASWAHLACHGDKERASIMLAAPSNTGPAAASAKPWDLSMREVQNVVKLAKGASVVLSTCNSGRGEIKAEGVVGLSRGFLLAGAAATIVSLWSVDDESTAVLMDLMYQHILVGKTVPRALQLAMLSFLEGLPSDSMEKWKLEKSKIEKWKRPKHWAGFLVVGATTRLPMM